MKSEFLRNRRFKLKYLIVLGIVLLFGCVKSKEFESLEKSCVSSLQVNANYSDIKSLYAGETVQIQEDWVIEGYIASSDEANNFFGTIYFQNAPQNPSEGLQIEIDIRDSHLFFEVGSKILIRLKGLYLGYSNENYKLGGTFNSFGNLSVGRLPYNAVFEHIFISCDGPAAMVPTLTTIPELQNDLVNTLVSFEDVEFSFEELNKTYAVSEEETERLLIDCNDNELIMLNSGYSDFQSEIVAGQRGIITGILIKENRDYKIVVRNLKDVKFNQERCEELIDEFTSNKVLFSELADPDNNSGARFVELYNSSLDAISLNGWQIQRFTNENTTVSSTIDLSEYTIEAESTLIISPNGDVFEEVYGFSPDIIVGTNSPADSNGDDNLLLIDPFGNVIDAFGIIGEDGSSTNHEFEDGKAQRRLEVTEGSAIYQFSEWEIFNDTGDSGTTNLPQIAPTDYSPGIR